MRWYSGGIFFQNTSPVEKNEDYFILTWNSGTTLPYRVVEPDYVCYPEINIIYPWSNDSKEKSEFLRIYSQCPFTRVDQLFL